MDFRIKPSVLADLLASEGYAEGTYDLVSAAGAGRDFLSEKIGERDFLFKQIQLSQKLHQIQEVVVLYHDNCGAYGIQDPAVEHDTQTQDLAKIKSLLNSDFPSLSFSAFIIKGVSEGNLSLQKII
jgi:hypothetical protein